MPWPRSLPTLCAVLRSRRALRAAAISPTPCAALRCSVWCYAMCGTELAYGATRNRALRLYHVSSPCLLYTSDAADDM
eukprot:20041-Rhodomonas_salina.1